MFGSHVHSQMQTYTVHPCGTCSRRRRHVVFASTSKYICSRTRTHSPFASASIDSCAQLNTSDSRVRDLPAGNGGTTGDGPAGQCEPCCRCQRPKSLCGARFFRAVGALRASSTREGPGTCLGERPLLPLSWPPDQGCCPAPCCVLHLCSLFLLHVLPPPMSRPWHPTSSPWPPFSRTPQHPPRQLTTWCRGGRGRGGRPDEVQHTLCRFPPWAGMSCALLAWFNVLLAIGLGCSDGGRRMGLQDRQHNHWPFVLSSLRLTEMPE